MTASLGRWVRLLLVAGLMATGLAVGSPAAPVEAQTPDYGATGPNAVEVQADDVHTLYFPAGLPDGPYPVILWGNGTGTTPSVYDGLLRHYASYGFIVAAANTTNAGSGNEMRNGLDKLTLLNAYAQSPFHQKVDLERVGTTGHSQGGGGAINAAKDPRVDTTFPIEPWLGNEAGLTTTALYLAGQVDDIIPPATVRARYDRSTGIPAAYAELAEATHFTPVVENAGGFRGVTTAWILWQLKRDQTARGLFVGENCGLCASPQWSAYEANAQLQAYQPPAEEPEEPEEPGEPPATGCVSAANWAHVEAGRARASLIFAFAKGSDTYLGLLWTTTALRQSAAETWEPVEAC